MELKVGDMVKMSNESSKDASNKTDVFELKAIIDGYFIGKDIKYGDVVSYQYAVPVEPEVVDVEVGKDFCVICPHCKAIHLIHMAFMDDHYAGIVWKENDGVEIINNQTIMWRDIGGDLFHHKFSEDSKLERASKVRFEKGGE